MRTRQGADARRRRTGASAWILSIVLTSGMALHAGAQAPVPALQKYPDVVAVEVRAAGLGRFDFDVTVSSPYDSPARYADAFRVSARDGTVFGERRLLHDHAGEQPFTRDLHGVSIPAGVQSVVVQARDSRFGYGGKSAVVMLPGLR